MMTETICINGSRTFTDYNLFKQEIEKLIDTSKKEFYKVISGGAKGADSLAERWAKEVGIEIQVFPANWNKYGKSAGYRRNVEMIEVSNRLISFWDGRSRGTKHTIDCAKSAGLPITIVKV